MRLRRNFASTQRSISVFDCKGVNQMRTKTIFAAAILLALCSPVLAGTKTRTEPAAAVVNGVSIPESALQAALASAQSRGLADTPELRAALKNQLIALELLRQHAAKKNLQNDREVQAAAAQARDAAMVQKYLRDAIRPSPVTETQVKQHYDAVVATLGPQEFKARMIQISDEATAMLVLAGIKSGKAFEDLARIHSRAPFAAAGGALDWVSFKTPPVEGQTQGLPLPIARALTQLQPGMITAEPIAWNSAYYVIKLDDARPTRVPAFEQARPALKAMLEQKELERAAAALVAELVKSAKIEQ
jgi:peptidyl-prolyl cis-trans isomerase C